MQERIRNFSIIAHIDHGKSTLADMLIRRCGGLSEREMKEQVLDTMDLERERGITIKSQTATLKHCDKEGAEWILNLIDTPGHVDFAYEVSRSLAACEGALLLVDASQGVQAQTIANCNIAADLGLDIIPIISKIDLPSASVERAKQEIEDMVGIDTALAFGVSSKTGAGAEDLLCALISRIPPPSGDKAAPLKGIIFDSWFDKYLGVVILVRIVDGHLRRGDRILLFSNKETLDCESIAVCTPKMEARKELSAGEVGCIITGLKDISIAQVGDTITLAKTPCNKAFPGFRRAKPHVFASLFPVSPNDFPFLREASEKLRLNDAALSFEVESSPALGFGLRCGFLGLLHMEISQERLEREYGLNLLVASPGVAYQVLSTAGELFIVDHPSRLPPTSAIAELREPIAQATIVSPADYVGVVMQMAVSARAVNQRLEQSGTVSVLHYELPMVELIGGFFNRLKSATRGFASMDYDFMEYRKADIVRLDVLINGECVEALAVMTPRANAVLRGRELTAKIRELIPRQMFDIAIQAAIGGKIVSRDTLKALRKNVTAKCYGGDVTRKRKLLERQKAGKKRMKRFGRVELPQEVFLAALRRNTE